MCAHPEPGIVRPINFHNLFGRIQLPTWLPMRNGRPKPKILQSRGQEAPKLKYPKAPIKIHYESNYDPQSGTDYFTVLMHKSNSWSLKSRFHLRTILALRTYNLDPRSKIWYRRSRIWYPRSRLGCRIRDLGSRILDVEFWPAIKFQTTDWPTSKPTAQIMARRL